MLTRENIKNGIVIDMIKAGGGLVPCLSEEEIVASRDAAIAAAPKGEDLWVFGYGSLIWNPAFHFEERRIARLHGYHRKFCLWTHLGRGSPDRPGMVLGLENGGSCVGVALRVRRDKVEEEFDIVWRREMVSGAYRPRWVRLRTDAGTVHAVAFVINPIHPRYAGDAREDDIIEALATAEGPLGACVDYLNNTVDHLDEMGIVDRPLRELRKKVAGVRAQGA
ncbi:MAG: gamma-glutamylcyclotransferase [Bauldia litoralis]